MQQTIAFVIVGIAAAIVLVRFFRNYLAQPLSGALLRRGKIKLAMKIRSQSQGSGCDHCGPGKKSCH